MNTLLCGLQIDCTPKAQVETFTQRNSVTQVREYKVLILSAELIAGGCNGVVFITPLCGGIAGSLLSEVYTTTKRNSTNSLLGAYIVVAVVELEKLLATLVTEVHLGVFCEDGKLYGVAYCCRFTPQNAIICKLGTKAASSYAITREITSLQLHTESIKVQNEVVYADLLCRCATYYIIAIPPLT